MLHGMEQSGYLECYNQEVNGKLRKYYRITPNGKKNIWKDQLQTSIEAADHKSVYMHCFI